MRLFLDTNVWVSALMAAGLCDELLTQCVRYEKVLTSDLVWRELEAVLRRKTRAPDAVLIGAHELWSSVPRIPDVAAPADDNDARLVAAAAAAGAAWFVTGDARVLGWQQRGATRIVTPRTAWIELFAPHLRER